MLSFTFVWKIRFGSACKHDKKSLALSLSSKRKTRELKV
ncbi:hypothetical protein L479_02752 [Exiguobacterium sp. S17]|nr:hypothetical protein L479_02752 [Exiguobacterium sp. S17]